MRSGNPIVNFVSDLVTSLKTHQQAVHFISRHKLWKGLMNYGWVSKLMIGVGLLIGLKMFLILNDWWEEASGETALMAFQSLGALFKNVFVDGYEFFFAGAFKYIILILMEILLFHVARRTVEIKTGKKQNLTFKSFAKAEVRMIKTALMAFVLESIGTVILSAGLNLVELSVLKPFLVMLLQCYFLGFVVVDNYNELYGIGIRESERITRQFAGVAIGIGLVTYMLLLIPIAGAVLAPFVGAVTGTLTMHALQEEFHLFVPLTEEMV